MLHRSFPVTAIPSLALIWVLVALVSLAPASSAAGDSIPAASGRIALSFSPYLSDPETVVSVGDVFRFYVVMELGESDGPITLGRHEGRIDLPGSVRVEHLRVGDGTALLRSTPDGASIDYCVVLNECMEIGPGQTVLAWFDVVSSEPLSGDAIALRPSDFSSKVRRAPAWSSDCGASTYPRSYARSTMIEGSAAESELNVRIVDPFEAAMVSTTLPARIER
jgi:hypothetical protein